MSSDSQINSIKYSKFNENSFFQFDNNKNNNFNDLTMNTDSFNHGTSIPQENYDLLYLLYPLLSVQCSRTYIGKDSVDAHRN